MDQAQWRSILSLIKVTSRSLPIDPRLSFADWLIAAMFVWAVAHDRPMCWACDRKNYPRFFRPRRLPSISQFHRRVNSSRFHRHLQLIHDALVRRAKLSQLFYIDGKPLPINPISGDRDAKFGYASGLFARGYKLHVMMNASRKIVLWSVMSMNHDERNVAHEFIEALPASSQRYVLMADRNYDSHKLHKHAWQRNAFLITKPRGKARHPVTRRQMGPARRALIDAWRRNPAAMQQIYKQRNEVERGLGVLTCTSGLLGPLPGFVRRLQRVRRWVGVKIILYNARIGALQNAVLE